MSIASACCTASITHADMFVYTGKTFEDESKQCVRDVCFPQVQQVAGQEVSLRGIADAQFLFKNIYTIALYATGNAHPYAEFAQNVPQQLSIQYHVRVNKKHFIRVAQKQLLHNPEISLSVLQSRIDKMARAYRSIQAGDQYDLVYVPEQGTQLFLNGVLLVTVPGADFAKAYFGIWISDYSYSKLMTRLLTNTDAPR